MEEKRDVDEKEQNRFAQEKGKLNIWQVHTSAVQLHTVAKKEQNANTDNAIQTMLIFPYLLRSMQSILVSMN